MADEDIERSMEVDDGMVEAPAAEPLMFVDQWVDQISDALDSGIASFIHITGLPNTGKYSIVKSALSKAKHCTVIEVNAVEVSAAPKLFFNNCLRKMAGEFGALAELPNRPVTTLVGFVAACSDLISQLCSHLSDCDLPSGQLNLVLVIRRSEHIRHFGPNFWAVVAKLNELVSHELCEIAVLSISVLPFAKFAQGTGMFPQMEVIIPNYSKSQMKSILQEKCRGAIMEPARSELFKKYSSFLVDIYWKATNDLRELMHVVYLHWPAFQKPLDENPDMDSADSFRKLWKCFEETSTQLSSNLLLRDISYLSTQMDANRDREMMELPLFSKYLVIAGYLASHNPPKTDKRFFVKFQAKKRKMAKAAKTDLEFQKTYNTLGPRLFGLLRLRHIFFAIVDDRILSSTKLDMQIRELEALKVFIRARSANPISGIKFKCTASSEFIRKLAANVEFDLDAYLFSP